MPHKVLMRMPGVEPGSQAWEACMIPLHYMRSHLCSTAAACYAGLPSLGARPPSRARACDARVGPGVQRALAGCLRRLSARAPCLSRARDTSMGGLYDTATRHALPSLLYCRSMVRRSDARVGPGVQRALAGCLRRLSARAPCIKRRSAGCCKARCACRESSPGHKHGGLV